MLKEKEFTHIETMFSGYFDWRAHFVSLKQLFFSRFWGWGPSVWGPDDGMPFPVGQVHWFLGGVLLLIFFHRWRQNRLRHRELWLPLLLGWGLFYAFLAHQRSVFLWHLITPLTLLQFPWRTLAGAAFAFSLAAGALGYYFRSRRLLFFTLLALIAWNWSFFKPGMMGPLTDEEKFSGEAWKIQQTAGIYDYLPSVAERAPDNPPQSPWRLIEGEVSQARFRQGTNWFEWQGEVKEEARLEASIFYFPGWRAWLDGRPWPIEVASGSGLMQFRLPSGKHLLQVRFTDTLIRRWANWLSLLAWWTLILFVFLKGKWKLGSKS